jgi:RHS repeat-associated protein
MGWLGGGAGATRTALPVPFAETLPTVQLTPSLGLTLAADKASAIPLGRKTTYTYDAAGQRVTRTDPLLHTTTSAYDGGGRLVSLTDALGGQVRFAYDAAGQQTSTTDPAGAVIARTYDALGNVATETNPAGGVTTKTYDLAGQLVSTVDPRGVTVTSTCDADGRRTGTAFPGGSVTYAYDAAGRRTSMVDPTGTTTYAYDADSEVTSVASPQGALTYAYDTAGQRSSMTMPGSRTVAYGYDGAGRLTQVQDWLGNRLTMGYNQDGSLTSVSRPNGVVSNYVRDAAQEVTAANHTAPSGPIERDAYTYDAAGNRTSAGPSASPETYQYDPLNRLTQATYANGDVESFTYDAAGNRTSKKLNGVTTSYTYDRAGRLVSAGSTNYAYDAAGNVVSAGPSSYGYDYAGRLSSASVNGVTSTYAYNADGVRVGATAGGTTTSYLVDRQASLPQVVSDGTSSYVQTDYGLAEQVSAAGSPTYSVADALGSIRQITDAAGSVVGTAGYDVFGAARSQSGATSIFGFTGEQTDPTGLLYLRARYLDPATGRFLSPDTVLPNAAGTTTQHITEAIGAGQPDALHRRDTTGLERADLTKKCPDKETGFTCDEYPFFSTYENGDGSTRIVQGGAELGAGRLPQSSQPGEDDRSLLQDRLPRRPRSAGSSERLRSPATAVLADDVLDLQRWGGAPPVTLPFRIVAPLATGRDLTENLGGPGACSTSSRPISAGPAPGRRAGCGGRTQSACRRPGWPGIRQAGPGLGTPPATAAPSSHPTRSGRRAPAPRAARRSPPGRCRTPSGRRRRRSRRRSGRPRPRSRASPSASRRRPSPGAWCPASACWLCAPRSWRRHWGAGGR